MRQARIGIYGLGTMGSALALNIAEQGFDVAVTNRETEWIASFMVEAGALGARLHPHESLDAFIAALETPRVILFMIPSGAPMDAMIEAITPLLAPGDTIIDGGNADFHSTTRRARQLAGQDLHFVGLGVSGGEKGARHGPSMMLGGSDHSWQQLEPILTTIAARFEGEPCVAHLGPDGAGHFVKTVHNGIEYADMQLIAEVYGMLRHGVGRPSCEIGDMFTRWDSGRLRSYLLEISGKLLTYMDPQSDHPMIDVIRDTAGQKGTGRWTVIEAVRLGQSASMIEAAVGARSWSAEKTTRLVAQKTLGSARGVLYSDETVLKDAFLAARVLSYAQGFRILGAAPEAYDWDLDFARIAEIWRAGCIIRSALLDDISEAFHGDLPEGQLILTPSFAGVLGRTIPALRQTVAMAVTAGHAVPTMSAALAWFDTMRQGHGTANLIQAQRDWFGHHGFERLDAPGQHHGPWWGQG